ncbi:hypothetical protein [Mesorhizobium sp. WSM3860]|uniref:hypothetical protein n=1 Tax=Mesorhizobium sp. WSM3860 TaxID=2029403 RepID=UPI001141096A|nr:hypothetical protein [Mesorhizobium sp. WSM3860]
MEEFLPANRMWQDAMTNVFWTCVLVVVDLALLSFALPNNVVTGIICILPAGYLLGSFNKRMSRAQAKFFHAKSDEGRLGKASDASSRNEVRSDSKAADQQMP